MKSVWNEDHREYKCCACGYESWEYYDYTKQEKNSREPFMHMEHPLVYQAPAHDYYPPQIHQYTILACPRCGCLQIDLSQH